jgi:outer membrane biosynthesis protein TonB
VRILQSPDPPRPAENAKATLIPAEPGPENKLPDYPADALKSGCGSGVVPVRIHVGRNGRVVSQGEVPGRAIGSDLCHARFAEAVRAAISKWGFFPAMRRVCPGDSEDCTSTPITIYLDLEFRFEVANGKGVVISP